jgi:hypothetical protein
MKERWKLIKDYPRHRVSDLGNIQKFHKGKWIDQIILYWEGNGYEMVYLYNPAKGSRKEYLHRCVAKAFVKNHNPLEYNTVIHKDGNTTNNVAKNLFWGTQKINMEMRKQRGNYYTTDEEKKTNSKLIPTDIYNIMLLKIMGVRPSEIARIFSVMPCTIDSILKGKSWERITKKQ